MDQQNTNQVPGGSHSKNTGMAILAYLGILIIVPLLTEAKNDPFVKFHLKQGLDLIISFVIGWAIGMVPILGWIVGFVIFVINIVLLIIGIINAASGKEKDLPIIGKFGHKFHF